MKPCSLRDVVTKILKEQFHWNKMELAHALGISRPTLYTILKYNRPNICFPTLEIMAEHLGRPALLLLLPSRHAYVQLPRPDVQNYVREVWHAQRFYLRLLPKVINIEAKLGSRSDYTSYENGSLGLPLLGRFERICTALQLQWQYLPSPDEARSLQIREAYSFFMAAQTPQTDSCQ